VSTQEQKKSMTIGIAGLGLIGGSLAKAYKAGENHIIYGIDIDDAILGYAQLSGAIDGVLNEKTIGNCDVIFIALNPGVAVEYLETFASYISKDTLVFDCCGVKESVCKLCNRLAGQYGFIFIGGHPMAGSHKAGFKNSRADLFHGAYMILVPPVYDDPVLFGKIEDTLKPIGFGHLTITSAEKHDEMIAFSSQLAHVVSNAFIKSPTAGGHQGFSAGSYRDLTRVAQLNAEMWGELLMDNRYYLIREIDGLIDSIKLYRDALNNENRDELIKLLEEGSRIKKELDS